jgi:subtilisin family serine protease
MRRFVATFWGIATLTLLAPHGRGELVARANAQLLPQVQVPGLPLPDPRLPRTPLDPALRGVGDTLRALPTRAVRAERLLARHRAELDRDAAGELVVRAEVVAIDITDTALARALDARFLVRRTRELADLGVKITVLQTPEGWSARRGLKHLRKLDPEGTYDFNHVYLDSGAGTAAPPGRAGDTTRVVAAVAAVAGADAPSGDVVRIGLIDTGVDATHVALRGSTVHRYGCDGEVVPSPHGTAVASLLAGSAENFSGAAPRARLYAADVYCGVPTGGAIDVVAAAFAWMARERVPVVNVSLVGPRNALMQRAVRALVERGHLIVAAVGNDGPAAPPLYPAAYDGVLGVTAVDGKRRVLLEACRGKHLDLAAPGADFTAATSEPSNTFVDVRGTSFAAPLVAGLLARELGAPDGAARDRAVAALTARAEDLGPRGRDDIYGAGLVGLDVTAARAP